MHDIPKSTHKYTEIISHTEHWINKQTAFNVVSHKRQLTQKVITKTVSTTVYLFLSEYSKFLNYL